MDVLDISLLPAAVFVVIALVVFAVFDNKEERFYDQCSRVLRDLEEGNPPAPLVTLLRLVLKEAR